MPYTLLLFATRKPDLSPNESKNYWEDKHLPILKAIAGSSWPTSHKRNYIARQRVENASGSGKPTYPAAVLAGSLDLFDCDAIAELVFADEPALKGFYGKVAEPDAARKIAEDEEKFLDRGKLKVVWVGETKETRNE